MAVKIIYHPKYLQYDFGSNHPFWPERAKFFLEKIERTGIEYKIIKPEKATDEDILLVHSKDYLQKVKQLAQTNGNLSIDTPINSQILEAACYSVGGSITALENAVQGNLAINLLGGLHHAGVSQSSGFCVFNDHSIAIKKLQQQGKIKKAMIFDLDVHAGQGTQEIFYSDPTVFTISIHQDPATLYPGTGFPDQTGGGAGKGYNKNVILPPSSKEKKYLIALDSVLPLAKKFKPDLLVLVLGVDTFRKDPLAQIRLDEETYSKIGKRFSHFKNLAIMFAGGYSRQTPDLWIKFLQGLLA